ncbi:MAG: transposase [Coprothermobacterota bacterium]|nr:transposase [Coprothermobacterota bacterium]
MCPSPESIAYNQPSRKGIKGTDLFIEYRQAVFVADGDYRHYLEDLREWKDAAGCRIYAYYLITNHVHLIMDPGEDERNLACLMKRVGGRHTRYVNKLERRTGTLQKPLRRVNGS